MTGIIVLAVGLVGLAVSVVICATTLVKLMTATTAVILDDIPGFEHNNPESIQEIKDFSRTYKLHNLAFRGVVFSAIITFVGIMLLITQ